MTHEKWIRFFFWLYLVLTLGNVVVWSGAFYQAYGTIQEMKRLQGVMEKMNARR